MSSPGTGAIELSDKKRALLALIQAQRRRGAVEPFAIKARARDTQPPLTPAQRRMWFLAALHPDDNAYMIYRVLRLRGALDGAALKAAFGEVVVRHESLRCRIGGPQDEPVLEFVAPSTAELPWATTDCSGEADPQQGLVRCLDRLCARHLSLRRDLPVFAELVKLGPEEHVFFVGVHHMVADGSSITLLYEELAEAYNQRRVLPVGVSPLGFGDFAAWLAQRSAHSGSHVLRQGADPHLKYWLDTLQGWTPLELPTDRVRPPIATRRGARIAFHLPQRASHAVKELAREHKTTVFITLLAVFKVLLFRFSGQTDIAVGTVVANRFRPELERVFGCFINTVVLRTDLAGQPSFAELLRRARKTAVGAYDHQEVPFDLLVRKLSPQRDPSRNPLFSVLFAHQARRYDETPPLEGLEIEFVDHDPGTSQLDLSLYTWEQGDSIAGHIEFSTDLFDESTIVGFVDHFGSIACQAACDPQRAISRFDLVSAAELRRLGMPSKSAQDMPASVLEMFDSQVRSNASAIAVIAGGCSMSYAELDARSSALCKQLRLHGVVRDSRVAMLLPRSHEMLVVMLGILRSGASYIPLDPNYPAARLAMMFEQAPPKVVVTSSKLAQQVPKGGACEVLMLDSAHVLDGGGSQPMPLPNLAAEDPAYTIFTSGSSGRPKGVCIPHRALTNFAVSMAKEPGITARDAVLALTTVSFDIAVLELLVPLCVGATVVVASAQDAREPQRIVQLIADHKVSLAQATPTTWRMLLAHGWHGEPQLRVLCGGEAMTPDLARELLPRCAELWNMYGPTETTIWSALTRVTPAMVTANGSAARLTTGGDAAVPLGRAIANTSLLVLDPHGQPVPAGVPGELHIGGAGLATGYVGDVRQTEQRFVHLDAPVLAGWSDPVYRTGDRVVWRSDGALDFLGRMDLQVKVRGFRIELGEIEAVLLEHHDIASVAVVVDREHFGEPRLVAYLCAPHTLTDVRLREYLRGILPDYMVPGVFVRLDTLPQTPAGKVDRNALPAPVVAVIAGERLVAQDDLEEQLLALWREVLGVASVRVQDSFFDLGGHSLLALQLTRRVEAVLGVELPVMSLFNAPSVRELAGTLRQAGTHVAWRALEAIKTDGDRAPLFFVGFSRTARALARHMPQQQPLWGLNPFGIWRHEKRVGTSIPALAEQLIEEMKSVQRTGPYQVLGFCGDGKLAFEIARQLQASGEQVGFLGIIDLLWGIPEVRTWRHTLANLATFGPAYVAHRASRRALRAKQATADRLLNMRGRALELLGLEAPVEVRERLWVLAYYEALRNYTLGDYPKTLHLFLSEEFEPVYSQTMAPLASHKIEPVVIPGFHDTLFDDENLAGFSRRVANLLGALSTAASA